MKKICILIIFITLFTLGIYNTAQALTREELEQKRVELKTQIEEAGKNIESIQIELTKNLEEINSLNEEIYLYEEEVKKISEKLNTVEIQILEIEKILEELQARYDYQKRITREKISICL